MAEQTAIDYESLEWKDDASGGTPIDAAALNRMEGGIADACAGVDELRTRRLPTYVVAQDGDTATQDVYMDDILGPCLVLDLATRTTYYESGGDEDGHRKELVSGADVDELRDSVSRTRIVSVQKGFTIAANGYQTLSFDIDPKPEVAAIAGFSTGGAVIVVAQAQISSDGGKVVLVIKNTASDQRTGTAIVDVLCLGAVSG